MRLIGGSNNKSAFAGKQQELIRNGIHTTATVLRAANTGKKIGKKQVMKLSLSVEVFTSAVLRIHSEALVAADKLPLAGTKISILINPDDTDVVIIL